MTMTTFVPADAPWFVFNYTTDREDDCKLIFDARLGRVINSLEDLPNSPLNLILIAHGDAQGYLYSTEDGRNKVTRDDLFSGLEGIAVYACVCFGGNFGGSPPEGVQWQARTFGSEYAPKVIQWIEEIKRK